MLEYHHGFHQLEDVKVRATIGVGVQHGLEMEYPHGIEHVCCQGKKLF
jgi:hypothetical protein